MKTLRGLINNATFFFCCLLTFLLVFEDQFLAPAWLQVAGRMHPLLLHFPIVLLILYSAWKIADPSANQRIYEKTLVDDLLLLAAFTASASALMGLILAKEGGYSPEGLFWHKWLGSATAFLSYGWYMLRRQVNNHRIAVRVVALTTLIVVTLAGHKGASITHGENFVLAPVSPKMPQENVSLEEAVVFTHLVQPILEEKCMACHNSRKAKGELVMESAETIMAGGKSGLLWDSLKYEESLMIKRIHLPENDEDHMPPKGKPQLTDVEQEILSAWITSGVPFFVKVSSLVPEHPLFQLAEAKFAGSGRPSYEFPAADPATVESLNSFYRLVTPVSANSPALSVRFLSSAAFSGDQLSELEQVKHQITELSLSKIAAGDADVQRIAQFENLEKLNLNFTQVTDEGLPHLTSLQKLKELSLSGTKISAAGLKAFSGLQNLTRVFIWNTGISGGEIDALKTAFAGVAFETGFSAENSIIKLPSPIIENAESIFSDPISLRVKHYINGAVLRYTLDGSEPDSVNSPVFQEGMMLEENAVLKIRAYKEGWFGSDVVSKTFLRGSIFPSEVTLLTQPDEKYKSSMEETLFDNEKGSTNHGDGYWLGYEGRKMEILLRLDEKKPVSSLAISYLASTGGYIMPPASVEIWYGDNADRLRLHKIHTIPQASDHLPVASQFLSFLLPDEKYSHLKVIVTPVMKLPAWHAGKGKPGWVFVDELLLN